MKKNLTELVFIVDCSGSMAGLESDTIGGLNGVLAQHRALEGEAVASIVLFNTATKVLRDRLPLKSVPPLSEADYRACGGTALLDAVGRSIRHIERVQGYLPEDYRAEKVIFVIATDGFENSSHRYSYADVQDAIGRKKEDGWEFLFLGANMDAVAEASRIGIGADRAATYCADGLGTAAMFGAVVEATCSMRTEDAPIDGSWKSRLAQRMGRARR